MKSEIYGKRSLKQRFCKHDYKMIARHKSVSENLWRCGKCGLFYIQHWGMGIGYSHQTPHISGWIGLDEEKKEYRFK